MSGRKKVTDRRSDLIKGRARISGLSISDLARKTGISASTMYRKLNKPDDLSLAELDLIDSVVGFTDDEVLYFVRWRRA